MTAPRAITPAPGPIDAVIRPPGSKSETIRSLVVAALARGESRLVGPLDSDDTKSTRGALTSLGVEIQSTDAEWRVSGTHGDLRPSTLPLDAGASGLTARSLIAAASLVSGRTTVVGRDRLPERPMRGLVEALRALGVAADDDDGHLPVTITGTGTLPGGRVQVASADTSQFATALLLVAPLARSDLVVSPIGLTGSRGYLDMTVRTMSAFGATIDRSDGDYQVSADGYRGARHQIEPDASAAVYPMVAAAVTGGRVTVEGLGSASDQPDMAVVGALEDMGCTVNQSESVTTVQAAHRLRSIDIDLSGSPDGALALAVACLFATNSSRLRNLGSLRLKESDRLAALTAEIKRLGAGARVEGDDLIIIPGRMRLARVQTHGDHRLAMSFALVGLVLPGIEIADPRVVTKTWPGYWEMLDSIAGTFSPT